MKNMAMIIFFLIVMSVLFLGSWYVYSRGTLALGESSYRRLFTWLFWGLTLTFLVGQILERGEPTVAGRIITHIGSLWLSVFLYLFLFVMLTDIVRLVHHFIPFFPSRILPAISNGNLLFITALSISILLNLFGFINARNPRVTKAEVVTEKNINGGKEFKIVMVSDVHIGAMLGRSRVEQMIDQINTLQPDLVIFAGDLVDHNPHFLVDGNIGDAFLKLKAPMGVFAVAGNHEFIGHAEVSIDYLTKYGIKYIRDSIVDIGNGILIAGRDDRDKIRFTGSNRKELKEILTMHDREKFLILIDHQPVDYAPAREMGVDLMLSGHTHKGQLWPFSYITNAVYPNHYGMLKEGNTYHYTSSGYGTWGPPVRTGNRPEIVEIILHTR